MFINIGKKIKIFAKILFWLGITSGVIASIVMFCLPDETNLHLHNLYIGLGFAFLFGAPLIFYLLSLFIFSWGEMVDNVGKLKLNFCKNDNEEAKEKIVDIREEQLKNLLDEGLITAEEYEKATSL